MERLESDLMSLKCNPDLNGGHVLKVKSAQTDDKIEPFVSFC